VVFQSIVVQNIQVVFIRNVQIVNCILNHGFIKNRYQWLGFSVSVVGKSLASAAQRNNNVHI